MTEREKQILCEFYKDEVSFKAAAERVNAGEPLAYVIGEWYFWRQTYRVTPDVLVPQPDTEHLVEQLVSSLPGGGRFLDICTGSGCIAISALCQRPDSLADAVEISHAAAQIAVYNAKANGVFSRFRLIEADAKTMACVSELRSFYNEDGVYDIIVSNPPYICTDVIDSLSTRVKAEPRIALDGGSDGMSFYREFLALYPSMLKKDGIIMFEIGYDQAEMIRVLSGEFGAKACRIIRDYGGNDRVAVLRF